MYNIVRSKQSIMKQVRLDAKKRRIVALMFVGISISTFALPYYYS